MSALDENHSPERPGSHPIAGVVIPFLVWCFLLPLIGYFLYRFAGNFSFYNPVSYGPFWNP